MSLLLAGTRTPAWHNEQWEKELAVQQKKEMHVPKIITNREDTEVLRRPYAESCALTCRVHTAAPIISSGNDVCYYRLSILLHTLPLQIQNASFALLWSNCNENSLTTYPNTPLNREHRGKTDLHTQDFIVDMRKWFNGSGTTLRTGRASTTSSVYCFIELQQSPFTHTSLLFSNFSRSSFLLCNKRLNSAQWVQKWILGNNEER